MLYIFYGEDSYRVSQKAAQFVNAAIKKQPGTGVFVFNFADVVDLDTVKTALSGVSLFDSLKVIKIKNILLSDVGKGVLTSVDWPKICEDIKTSVVIEDVGGQEEVKKKLKNLFSLASTESEYISNLAGVQLTAWIKREFADRGGAISSVATQRLVMRGGTQTAGLVQEIIKLCNFCMDKEVTPADVDLLVTPRGELNIFDLVDACAQKNRAQAAEFLYKELALGRDPYQILAAITYQYRNLLLVSDLAGQGLGQKEIATMASLHPFVVKKTLAQMRQFKEDELKRAYGLLLAMDTGTKKGALNLSDELYRFILR